MTSDKTFFPLNIWQAAIASDTLGWNPLWIHRANCRGVKYWVLVCRVAKSERSEGVIMDYCTIPAGNHPASQQQLLPSARIVCYFSKHAKCSPDFRPLTNVGYRSVVQLNLSLFVASRVSNLKVLYLISLLFRISFLPCKVCVSMRTNVIYLFSLPCLSFSSIVSSIIYQEYDQR